MKKILIALAIVVAAVIAIIGGSLLLANNGIDNPISDAIDGAKYDAANAALDATGIKDRADKALRSNVDEISRQTGIPAPMVNSMVDDLDIPSWKVVKLPDGATASSTSSIDYEGYSADITTYDDPSVITISTDVGSVTLEVPESAQGYAQYLKYLK